MAVTQQHFTHDYYGLNSCMLVFGPESSILLFFLVKDFLSWATSIDHFQAIVMNNMHEVNHFGIVLNPNQSCIYFRLRASRVFTVWSDIYKAWKVINCQMPSLNTLTPVRAETHTQSHAYIYIVHQKNTNYYIIH